MSASHPQTEPDFGLPSDRGGKDVGIFLPMANGGWIMSSNAPPLDASYAYNRKAAVLADELGLDFVMSMAKWRGYGGPRGHWDTSLDAQMLIAGLAEATKRVKVWTTVHTFLQNPAVTAKMIATLDQMSGGRAGLNVVTGSYKAEFDQMNAWPEGLGHDERYDLAAEWIEAVKRLWSEPSVTMDGRYIKLNDCRSDPKPVSSPRPFLVCAGVSPKGMQFTLEHMDAIFLTGADNADLARTSRAVKARAADFGRVIKTYTMMTIVLAETDAAAEAKADFFREGLDEEALRGMMRAYGFLDSEIGKENAFVASARSSFMTPRLIGSPQTVAEQANELMDQAELDGLMLIFPDYIEDQTLFAAEVLPKIRARFAPNGEVRGHAA
jgi:pyrimidine oxygenase